MRALRSIIVNSTRVLILASTISVLLGCQESRTAELPSTSRLADQESGKSGVVSGSKQETEIPATEENSSTLTVLANWEPISESTYDFGNQWETLRNLAPAEPARDYQQAELAIFLPPKDAVVGDIWKIDAAKTIPVLNQLHSGATHELHHGGPQGAFGCIAGESESELRVRTRIHAQFKLTDGKYIPSQFAGDIVLDKATRNIIAFKLHVPPRRNNVDMNWNRVPDEGEVWVDKDGNTLPARAMMVADIGYCPRLELAGGDWQHARQIKWKQEKTYREVDEALRKKFYAFAEIDWLPFEEAVARSRQTGKPLHVVALFGVLDDESC